MPPIWLWGPILKMSSVTLLIFLVSVFQFLPFLHFFPEATEEIAIIQFFSSVL